jgi:RNA polymerase sigma-70 factor (ECF subfamily)
MMQPAVSKSPRLTDSQLLEKARAGDADSFGTLIQRHWHKCVDVGCYFLRNQSDAEDVAQTAIMKAYEHLNQYQGEAEFSTWLARIVANECLMLLRLRRRARFVYLDDSPSEPKTVPVQLAGSEPDPEGALGFAQLREALAFEVRRIPSLMRNVVMLRDIQGLSMTDVAGRLGITVSAAKSRLVRARGELRVRMSRHVVGLNHLSPLCHKAAPLERVGRHCMYQVQS